VFSGDEGYGGEGNSGVRRNPAKAIRRGSVTEPTHRTISALDPAMILFNSVVEILAGPASRRHPTLSGWPVGNCHARPWSPAPGLRR
jgi:hypothetical protein